MDGRAPAAALVLLALTVGAAVSQEPTAGEVADSLTIHGWIIDSASRERLASVYLVVDGTPARTVTEEGGGFRLTVPAESGYTIRAWRFGYIDTDFEVDAALLDEALILSLEPAPIPVEGVGITMDRLAEFTRRLEQRTRAYAGMSRTIDPEAIRRSGAASALEAVRSRAAGLFECVDTPAELCARPRPSSSLRGPVVLERPVRVCVDERRAWGSVTRLSSIPAEEIHRIELYGLGGRDQVRVYTRWFMARNSGPEGRGLAPTGFGGAPACI